MGAGSIGCWLGGSLAAAGAEVVLVGRHPVTELTLEDLTGATKRAAVRYETKPDALAGCDVILCCVKSAQTAEVAEVMPRDAVVVSMQNGLRNAEILKAKLPNALGGIVGFNVVSKGNGVFRRATTGPLVIEDHPLVRGLPLDDLELAKDIRAKQWSKLIMNLNNAVSALTDRPTPDLLFKPEYRRILRAIMAEAIDVLQRTKTKMARVGPLPARLFPRILALPTPVLRVVAAAQLKVDPEARSSMWEDLSRGRLTEVDDLNGEIVRLAEAHQLEAPLNRRVCEIVHEVESARSGSPKLSADALWARLRSAS
jgi:2-dehydropantoate 2-reductase